MFAQHRDKRRNSRSEVGLLFQVNFIRWLPSVSSVVLYAAYLFVCTCVYVCVRETSLIRILRARKFAWRFRTHDLNSPRVLVYTTLFAPDHRYILLFSAESNRKGREKYYVARRIFRRQIWPPVSVRNS